MPSLAEDLQTPKRSLQEFKEVTLRVLHYLPSVISKHELKRGYTINLSEIAGSKKYVRPIRTELFISNPNDFEREFLLFVELLGRLKAGDREFPEQAYSLIDRVSYTMQQSIGAGLDLVVDPNSSRKHVGNRFEELIRIILKDIGVVNKKIVFSIPYETDTGTEIYSCETDIVFSPYEEVRSTPSSIDPKEFVVSLKSSSKDRMSKMFMDKILLQEFVKSPIRHVGIFVNDVQRKGSNDISYTFVPGLFLVYTKFIAQFDGIYFIDPPAVALKQPYNRLVFPFSKFILKDVWAMITL
jgi:hypothetical protein